MKYYVVDAFTDEVFKGNPAGVCLLDVAIPDEKMQKIAFENNLAETAFLLKKEDTYYLRWFTPDVEIDLCGHATLATSYVVMNYVDSNMTYISFETQSGTLTVTRNGNLYRMDFPSRMPVPTQIHPMLEEALGCKVLEAHIARDLVVVVEDEETVRNLHINIDLIRKISKDIVFAVTVTAKGDTCDFVSRFFAPNAGIIEDPVTGSSHSSLIPFWSERLHKEHMLAKQLSPRGGVLICENAGDRVHISGNAVCYLIGEIQV
ncbi:MAG TPA: PhzF family phenazine biosynthesis protein [Lachnospiraceae bacterium]|nr:PhzF family phenazine biosynthesis protein [Lachnospiraceae bacterium]